MHNSRDSLPDQEMLKIGEPSLSKGGLGAIPQLAHTHPPYRGHTPGRGDSAVEPTPSGRLPFTRLPFARLPPPGFRIAARLQQDQVASSGAHSSIHEPGEERFSDLSDAESWWSVIGSCLRLRCNCVSGSIGPTWSVWLHRRFSSKESLVTWRAGNKELSTRRR